MSRLNKRRRKDSLPAGSNTGSKKRLSPKSDSEPLAKRDYKEPSIAVVTVDGAKSDSTISSPPSPSTDLETAVPVTPLLPDPGNHVKVFDRLHLQNGGHQASQGHELQDVEAVLDAILDHSRRVDETVQQYKADWGEVDTSNLPMVEANLRLKIQSLSVLDSLVC